MTMTPMSEMITIDTSGDVGANGDNDHLDGVRVDVSSLDAGDLTLWPPSRPRPLPV